jgi:hypothetical protein
MRGIMPVSAKAAAGSSNARMRRVEKKIRRLVRLICVGFMAFLLRGLIITRWRVPDVSG